MRSYSLLSKPIKSAIGKRIFDRTSNQSIRNNFKFFSESTQAVPSSTFVPPSTVDINIIGRCNLDCTWCWGPDHKAEEPVSVDEWKEIMKKIRSLGTGNIVFSGGEPLMKDNLDVLLKYAKIDLGMRVTLSTNGILLKRKAKAVLPFVDDVGIPLDGHTHDVNKLMRKGTLRHFDAAISAINLVQDEYPGIELTIRTVVARPNLMSVPLMGDMIMNNVKNYKNIRWKLYQVNPIGPRKAEIIKGEWVISDTEFEEVISKLKEKYKSIKIHPQMISQSMGRYFIIFPDGRAHVIMEGRDKMPEDILLGNVNSDFLTVLSKLKHYYIENNFTHGSKDSVSVSMLRPK